MDIEQRTPMIAKKLWGIIRAILYMVKKNLSKTIPWFEFHMMLKKIDKARRKSHRKPPPRPPNPLLRPHMPPEQHPYHLHYPG
ncbi:hypothetical protein HanRHA438_Chr10g0476641 [Helianthus annuus]|nr:hypothetical protein HanRHA438_Chr10g0476641 [Helianthus annuus]